MGDFLEADSLRFGPHEFAHPRSQAQLEQDRAIAVGHHGEPEGGFTCDNCGSVSYCALAFDWYNTNGDCLAEK
jgi:hypothetical protein